MSAEFVIDLLRNTLADRGHVRYAGARIDQGPIPRILQHGEFLVSLLGHDKQLIGFLNELMDGDFLPFQRVARNFIGGYYARLSSTVGHDFDQWVETVKFHWLINGVAETINFVSCQGFIGWCQKSVTTRERFLDSMTLMAQRRLRDLGVKYRDFAEFFADAASAKALADKLGSEQETYPVDVKSFYKHKERE
jgi:hypothetical protein